MAESAASAKSTKLRSMSSEVSGKKGLKSSLEDVTCSIAGGWRADLPEFPFQYGTTLAVMMKYWPSRTIIYPPSVGPRTIHHLGCSLKLKTHAYG